MVTETESKMIRFFCSYSSFYHILDLKWSIYLLFGMDKFVFTQNHFLRAKSKIFLWPSFISVSL